MLNNIYCLTINYPPCYTYPLLPELHHTHTIQQLQSIIDIDIIRLAFSSIKSNLGFVLNCWLSIHLISQQLKNVYFIFTSSLHKQLVLCSNFLEKMKKKWCVFINTITSHYQIIKILYLRLQIFLDSMHHHNHHMFLGNQYCSPADRKMHSE